MTTVDHKRIGLMYLWPVTLLHDRGRHVCPAGAASAPDARSASMDAETYNRFFTLHGMVMVFLFIIPSIPGSLGNFVLPLMLGAKDVAFPRLNLMSFYLCWTGAVMAWARYSWAASTLAGRSTRPTARPPAAASSLMSRRRSFSDSRRSSPGSTSSPPSTSCARPGMGWFDMPLFVWGIYATAIIQILATPVLAITLAAADDRAHFQIGIFDSQLGGDPVLFQHFFWFYSHPAVYIMILPGMAIISEMIPTFSRKTIFGYRAIAYSQRRARAARLPGVGPPHVRRRPVRSWPT